MIIIMKLAADNYCSYFDKIQELFQNAVQKIFTNKCSSEQTKLHSFYIEQTGNTRRVYFDKEQLPEERFNNKLLNKALVREYLHKNFEKRKYILEESKVYHDGERQYKIFWVLLSKCLDLNHGKMLLKYFFQQLAEFFSEYLEMLSNGDKESEKYWSFVMEQSVFEAAEVKIAFLLQEMFEPFNMDIVNSLSGEYYEKSECVSNMVFLPYSIVNRLNNDDLIYHFNNIDFISSNNRLLRKLLQITQNELFLVLGDKDNINRFQVLGICKKDSLNAILKEENGAAIPCISVEIKGHMQWDIFLNNKYIFTCQNGHYRIRTDLDEEYLKEKISEYFGSKDDYSNLIKSIIKSQSQEHGAMLVIMEAADASEEVKRLGSLKYGLVDDKPHEQTEINCLNAIDGSVIIDTDGNVHGIGMILDGISYDEGDLARGARYNSARKYRSYLRRKKHEGKLKAMILVVSEDASLDILYA